MRCPLCGFANPEGMKFCGECAAPLRSRCPTCGFENPPQFKFCGECATPLQSPFPAATSSTISPPQAPLSYTPRHLAEKILTSKSALEFPSMAAALGAAYTLGGRIAEAVPLLTEAMEQRTAMEMVSTQALCRLSLREAHVAVGRLKEAHTLAERALAEVEGR
jgi:hypothetical protein